MRRAPVHPPRSRGRGRGRPARTVALGVIAAAAALGGCGGDGAGDPPTVRDGWATPVGREAAAVYMTIVAPERDELTAARVERTVASRVEVVNPADGGEDGPGHLGHLDPGGSLGGDHDHAVALPADRPVALEPDGAYLAVGPLAEPLASGDTFSVTLSFRDAPDVTADVTVRSAPP